MCTPYRLICDMRGEIATSGDRRRMRRCQTVHSGQFETHWQNPFHLQLPTG